MDNATIANCGNCRFSIAATDGKGKINWNQRFCRCMPPIPIPVGMSQQGPVIQSFWPTMQSTAVCGQHQFSASFEVLPGEAKPETVETAKLS